MKKNVLVILTCSLILVCCAHEKVEKLHFKTNGFSINALEGTTDEPHYPALVMLLPASEGFSPNVNVLIQTYKSTIQIQDYLALSKKEFETAALTLIDEKNLSKTGVMFEYAGTMQGRKMHWYARAEQVGKKVYLVTATATEEQWQAASGKLKSCVNSFQIDNSESAN